MGEALLLAWDLFRRACGREPLVREGFLIWAEFRDVHAYTIPNSGTRGLHRLVR